MGWQEQGQDTGKPGQLLGLPQSMSTRVPGVTPFPWPLGQMRAVRASCTSVVSPGPGGSEPHCQVGPTRRGTRTPGTPQGLGQDGKELHWPWQAFQKEVMCYE